MLAESSGAPVSVIQRVEDGTPVWWMLGTTRSPLSSAIEPLAVTAISDQTSPSALSDALGGGGILVIYATVGFPLGA